MDGLELFIIALGVSMDAFAVAICKGLSAPKLNYKNALMTGLFFGGFQALMPLIGYLLGTNFRDYITSIIPWIAFILLSIIGLKMIKESQEDICEKADDSFSVKSLFALAIATSIDALAIGVTFAFLQVNILLAIILIGLTTFSFSFLGVKIGNVFGRKFQSKAEIFGGVVLILMGLKILISYLF